MTLSPPSVVTFKYLPILRVSSAFSVMYRIPNGPNSDLKDNHGLLHQNDAKSQSRVQTASLKYVDACQCEDQSRMAFEKIGSPPAQSLNIVYLIESTRVALSCFAFVEKLDTTLYCLLIGSRIYRLVFPVKMGSMLSTKLTYNYLHSTPQPFSICNNCFAWSRS